jgi:eukaryotic-like serine/threonine-protein kinase
MNSSDWNHLTEWYSVWLSTDASGRARLREQLAREQPALIGEADALVASSRSLSGFLETPALVLAAHEIAEHTLTLSAGDRVGPYRIVGLLAQGGMGVVYRATDVRLDRKVALKMMTYAGLPDDGRVERFLQEARVTASLDHPNIVRMFDVGMFEGRPYLVTELIEGQTLRERLAGGEALDPVVACRLAAQIAKGLVAAHASGLVHRDLKPENIIITRSGDAKILDFGIAKLAEDPLSRDGFSTLSGVLLGTAGYLAPEQILGGELDGRADLFALGSMLFEMLTGERAFARAHVVDTLHAILHEPAPNLRSRVRPRLAAVVERLLEREPASRFQSAADLAWALENLDASANDGPLRPHVVAPPSGSRFARFWAVAAAVILLGLLGAMMWWLRPSVGATQTAGPLAQFTWTLPAGVSLQSAPVVAPDHARLVFVGAGASGPRLFARDLSSLEAVAIPGTEGARQPFWSPDGQSVGFFAGGKLMKVALRGGAPVALADAPDPRGGTWNAAGVILFQPIYRDSNLFRVPSAGGSAEAVTQLDEARGDVTQKWPVFLPDGEHFLFQTISLDDSRRGVYLGRLGDPAGGGVMLFRSETGAAYVPLPDGRTGFILSAMGDHIEVRRFDQSSLAVQGDARVLRLAAAAGTPHHEPMLGASTNVLAFSDREVPWGVHPAAVDLDGNNLRLWPDLELGGWLRLSPDGRQLLRSIVDPLRGNPDIWVEDLARGTRVRVTTSREFDVSPVWSTDGRRIAFRTGTVTKARLAVAPADGTGDQVVLPCPVEVCEPTDWSPDGRLLAVNGGGDVWAVSIESGTPSKRLLAERFVERDARFSPDGRWIAYVSEESGRPEVSVRSLTGAPNRLVASSGGGDQPVWGRNGRELFYVGPDGHLHSVAMRAEGISNLIADAPRVLNVPPLGPRHWGTVYDVSPDGRRVFLPRPDGRTAPREISIVLNWIELLR